MPRSPPVGPEAHNQRTCPLTGFSRPWWRWGRSGLDTAVRPRFIRTTQDFNANTNSTSSSGRPPARQGGVDSSKSYTSAAALATELAITYHFYSMFFGACFPRRNRLPCQLVFSHPTCLIVELTTQAIRLQPFGTACLSQTQLRPRSSSSSYPCPNTRNGDVHPATGVSANEVAQGLASCAPDGVLQQQRRHPRMCMAPSRLHGFFQRVTCPFRLYPMLAWIPEATTFIRHGTHISRFRPWLLGLQPGRYTTVGGCTACTDSGSTP